MDDMNWSSTRDLLRSWRENNERKSEDVVELWESVLESKINKLGNEKHVVLEQVCIAALDCNRIDIAEQCIKKLSAEFSGSLRVRKFYAMKLEAEERYNEALLVLEAIIKKDETNSAPRKRHIAILKAQGKFAEAIKELTDYLKIFMADVEAWHELSELYINEQDYAKAAFCVEELILHNPHNHLLYQRYADIRYTQGGFENMELARSYYSQALKLNSNNLRALYGIVLTSGNISVSQKCSAQKKKEATKLSHWALNQINKKFQKVKQVYPTVNLEERINALQIS